MIGWCLDFSRNEKTSDIFLGDVYYFRGNIISDNRIVHKYDLPRNYESHGISYYYKKVFRSRELSLFGIEDKMGKSLFDINPYKLDLLCGMQEDYQKNLRPFILKNRDSVIEFDCQHIHAMQVPIYLYFIIAKDMGLDFVANHIAVSSHNRSVKNCYNPKYDCPEIHYLGRFERFK